VYLQVTIPENGQSFALIYSIEDPGDPSSPVGGVGVQVRERWRGCTSHCDSSWERIRETSGTVAAAPSIACVSKGRDVMDEMFRGTVRGLDMRRTV